MPDPVTSLSELPRYLKKVAAIFDLDQVLSAGTDLPAIARYYRESAGGYDLFHSTKGSVHMALNPDGHFQRSGYRQQAILAYEAIRPQADDRLLELGCGKGFNLGVLAELDATPEYIGVELTHSHAQRARDLVKAACNTHVLVGDFHSLPFSDRHFSGCLEVESICHAQNMRMVLKEAFRVLRPGSRFVIFDGFQDAVNSSAVTRQGIIADLDLSMQLIEVAMAVPRFWHIDEWIELCREVGFTVVHKQNISASILPNLYRLQVFARAFFKLSGLARVLKRQLNATLVMNSIAGLLMPFTVSAGVQAYYHVILER